MAKKTVVTNDGSKGGNLVGKPHRDKSGKDVGGIKAVVKDANNRPVELEGGEVIINKEASKKHWRELSRINQSAGGGVPINKPIDPHDEDPEEYEKGGKIEFNPNKLPNKWILKYAENIKENHPEVWKMGGNVYGNEAFANLKRVAERGYWLDSEEWFYIKWRSFVARHKGNFRIAGVIAMLKWVDKVDKGWQYMKTLIEAEIKKKSKKDKGGWTTPKAKRMSKGGNTPEQDEKIAYVMREFKDGKLKSSSGDLVTDEKQAIAIALSEAGINNEEYKNGGRVAPTKSANDDDQDYEVGQKGTYRGKQEFLITISKVTQKNIYFINEETGETKRSERKNFTRLFVPETSADNLTTKTTSPTSDDDQPTGGDDSKAKRDARRQARQDRKDARTKARKDQQNDEDVDYFAMFKENNDGFEMANNELVAMELQKFAKMVDENRMLKTEYVDELVNAADKLG